MYVCLASGIQVPRVGQGGTVEASGLQVRRGAHTPNLPKIIPAKICWLKTSGKFPLDMRILLESDPPKSRISVRRSAAEGSQGASGLQILSPVTITMLATNVILLIIIIIIIEGRKKHYNL